MNQFSFFIGIDVSKKWLDVALLTCETGELESAKIDNTAAAIKEYVSSLKLEKGQWLFCLENTGRYSETFLEVSALLGLNTCLEHPLHLKRSQGMTRGKTDKVDAIRIAEYAYRFHDKLKLWKPEEKTIKAIKKLQSKRELLVKTKTQLKLHKEDSKDKDLEKVIKTIERSIVTIESKIDGLIKSNYDLNKYNKLAQSVPGVGKVLATKLLVETQGFTRFNDARKLASHSGIAPFPYQSGSSINYGKRVSKLGNKKLKKLLNLAAWNAIRGIPSLKAFYERKVEQGKHKLSAINAVRNKLVAIVISVINRQTPFAKEYLVN